MLQFFFPVCQNQRLDHAVQVAVQHTLQITQRQADAVIGHAVLREVVGAYLFAAVTAADLALAAGRQQAEGMRGYNEAKADAYISKQMDGFFECAQINRRFDNQLIFRATLYADGTIKMPDGQIFTPRNPYDATLVYKKGDNGRSEAERIYKKRANRRVPAGALQFRTDSAPVSNPDYVPGQSAPAIIEPAGFAGVELQQVNAPAESSVSSSGSSYSGESSIGHIKRSY